MDYDRLIDADVRAFIRKTEEAGASVPDPQTPEEMRRAYDRVCAAFRRNRPNGLDVHDRLAQGLPLRVYATGEPTTTVLYFHGGGWVLGGLDSHDDICAEICALTGYRVVAVDYRLSPEHVHPAAYEDALSALDWVEQRFHDRVVLAGDSAGANLAAAVSRHARGREAHRVCGQVLIYPDLGGDTEHGSYLNHANAPLLSRADVLTYRALRVGISVVEEDPTRAPLHCRNDKHLPSTIAFAAEFDPLHDDAMHYCRRLNGVGVLAKCITEPGLVHGYLRARHMSATARDSFERIILAIEALGQGIWPYD